MDRELLGQQAYYPAFALNGYIQEQIRLFGINSSVRQEDSFITPVTSTNLDDLYGEILFSNPDGTLPVLIVYDTLSRFRPSPFYRHKREQILYTVHGPLEDVLATIRIINAALDREDSSAQDVNTWSSKNQESIGSISQGVFFHNTKTFQVDESRDLLELQSAQGSMRMIYRNKVIVQYDYHTNSPEDAFYT
jgi:hypothetical protein